MSRMEPPPIASWIVEHCIPAQRDQALPGDLLEAFQEGRSNGWYWRQVLSACAVGWAKYLEDRAPLIVFALLWSMLAPAWTAIVDRVQNREVPWPASVAAWVALNLAFIWTGMVLFIVLHPRRVLAFHKRRLRRAFGIAAAVFLPAYFATFILMNLFAWPGLALDWRRMSPLVEIVDFKLWADAIRLPYFATILASMWGATRAIAIRPSPLMEPEWRRSSAGDEQPMPSIRRTPDQVARMLIFMVGAGLLNALIAGFLLCRLPEAHHPSLSSLVLRAAVYVVIGAAAGVMGTYVYWNYPSSWLRTDAPLPFGLFALVCAAGWVWVPAMVLFSEQLSALCGLLAFITAYLVCGEVRRLQLLMVGAQAQQPAATPAYERHLFAESLHRAEGEPWGYIVALCLYGAGWAFAERSNMTAGALLALAACVFTVKGKIAPSTGILASREYRRAGMRLAGLVLPAILVTIWALLDGVAHRNHLAAVNAAGETTANEHGQPKADTKHAAHSGNGYESVVLWPYPPKKQIVAPVEESPLLAPGTKQPVVIRFDGQYWYMQPPDEHPGPRTHQARGTPLDVRIASANTFPLIMEAHEFLGAAIRTSRCREIRVSVENRETAANSVTMAVWLRNSSVAGDPAVYLGQQPIGQAGRARSRSDEETLVFAIPARAKVRRFDEISVQMLPDAGHQRMGPRIAIEQFELVPR